MKQTHTGVASSGVATNVFSLHWVIFRHALFMAFVAIVIFSYLTQFKVPGMVVVIIAVGMWVEALLRYMKYHLAIQNGLLSISTGAMAARQHNIPISEITAVEVSQTKVGRWLDYGDVRIHFQIDDQIHLLQFQFVANPNALKARLENKST